MNLNLTSDSAPQALGAGDPPQNFIPGSKADDLAPPPTNVTAAANISDSKSPLPDVGSSAQPAPPTVHDIETIAYRTTVKHPSVVTLRPLRAMMTHQNRLQPEPLNQKKRRLQKLL